MSLAHPMVIARALPDSPEATKTSNNDFDKNGFDRKLSNPNSSSSSSRRYPSGCTTSPTASRSATPGCSWGTTSKAIY
eukprot:13210119-Heterocapsa_arctica.AAC.1